jgi:hypothetical protein
MACLVLSDRFCPICFRRRFSKWGDPASALTQCSFQRLLIVPPFRPTIPTYCFLVSVCVTRYAQYCGLMAGGPDRRRTSRPCAYQVQRDTLACLSGDTNPSKAGFMIESPSARPRICTQPARLALSQSSRSFALRRTGVVPIGAFA